MSSSDSPADDRPDTPAAPAQSPRRRLHGAYRLALFGLLAVAVGGMLGLAGWLTLTAAGTQWVLAKVPGLSVTAPQGRLLGDFSAERLELRLADGTAFTVAGLRWRGLALRAPGAPEQWLSVRLEALEADRVDLELPPASGQPSPPPSLPQSLRLPLQFELGALRVGELHSAALGKQALRDIRAKLHLGGERGGVHRIDELALAWGAIQASGALRVAARAPFEIDTKLNLSQPASGTTVAWQAAATLLGPLQAPQLKATLRAQPAPNQPPQALDVQATLRPFERWPLGELLASTESLDLSALHAAAPVTALTGRAVARTAGMDQPASVSIDLRNAAAGRWNDRRLPLRRIQADANGRPDQPEAVDLPRLELELGSAAQNAGRITGQGRWTPDQWQLDAQLDAMQPEGLDARAAAMALSGPLTARGSGFASGPSSQAKVQLKTELAGQLSPQLLSPSARNKAGARDVKLRLDATLNELQIDLRELLAQAGEARATASGQLKRASSTARWQAQAKAALVDFDPLPWWPGEAASPWRKGPHRLNLEARVDLALAEAGAAAPAPPSANTRAPASTSTPATPTPGVPPALAQFARSRGELNLKIARSQLAGVPVSGDIQWRNQDGAQMLPKLALELGGNRITADGQISSELRAGAGERDRWTLALDAPALKQLAPLWPLLQAAGPASDARFAGTAKAQATVEGRWPQLRSSGSLEAEGVRVGANAIESARGQWRIGSALNAPLEAELNLRRLQAGNNLIDTVALKMQGTGRDHSLSLRAEAPVAPPPWTQALQTASPGRPGAAGTAGAAGAAASMAMPSPTTAASPAPAAASPTAATAATSATASQVAPAAAPVSSTVIVQLQGGWLESGGTVPEGWRGQLGRLEWQDSAQRAAPWVRLRDVGLALQWAGGLTSVSASPGRAELMGGALRWERLKWQAATATTPALVDVQANIEPLSVAPLLARLQPSFGWGGDLSIGGRIMLRSGPAFQADVVIERQAGDLTVTDETGTQSLGLSDLRLALNVDKGVWSFTQGLAGKTLGVGAGAVVMNTSPQTLWPAADTPIQGVLELQVANLGTWGTWVPAGWRLGGSLRTSATIAGKFGAPEYTGEIRGKGLSVRNFLEGVNVSDGELAVALQGETARIEKFDLRAGAGRLTAEGVASFGDTPKANLTVRADHFQLLGRVDRRVITSGEAQLQLNREAIRLDGKFGVDEALIDFSRSEAPSLSDDVTVVRATPAKPQAGDSAADKPAAAAARKVALNLQVSLGDQLRLRGLGLDTRLVGDLFITSPEGRLAVNGVVSTADGKFAAYGQKLTIDRGRVSFIGPVDNPRLDIEAVRPDVDIRVGVAITGTAITPRIRLFSVPELSEVDKLSWLVLGHASDNAGGTETALLQRAAMALLAGEGEGKSDEIIRALGLDTLSVRKGSGEVRETVVSLGKQISQRWYVGYERSLNATSGTWQLIYRVAKSFTLRAQAGADASLDAIWSWRW